MYEIIKKWSINQAMLAEKMGMSVGNFKNKINPNQKAYRLTEKESEKLKAILLELRDELNELDESDSFNDALKQLVQKEV